VLVMVVGMKPCRSLPSQWRREIGGLELLRTPPLRPVGAWLSRYGGDLHGMAHACMHAYQSAEPSVIIS